MSSQDHSETIRSLRRVRWAQVLVPLAIGLALVGTVTQLWMAVPTSARPIASGTRTCAQRTRRSERMVSE